MADKSTFTTGSILGKPKQAKKKTVVRKDTRLDLKGELPTTDIRNFLTRDAEGRDGTGPCTVAEGQRVPMPNGDLAMAGDTFDPVVEQMTVARFNRLLDLDMITTDKKMEDKLMKHWTTKGSSGGGCS